MAAGQIWGTSMVKKYHLTFFVLIFLYHAKDSFTRSQQFQTIGGSLQKGLLNSFRTFRDDELRACRIIH